MYDRKIKQLKEKFDQIALKLKEDFASIRAGGASVSLVENIRVTYYGSTAALKQMASLTAPDASRILIQPWDKNALGDIELAIRNSDLGLEPTNDGNIVRISLPPITEERRRELTRNIRRKGEEARIALRSVRKECWEEIKKLEKAGDITEDDRYAAEKELNSVIDEYNQKIERAVSEKEGDLKSL